MHAKASERLIACVALAMTVGCGLWVRSDRSAWDAAWAQRLGTMLWALALVLLLRALCPRWSVVRTGLVALGVASGVEFLQLTGIPREISTRLPPARLILGSDFDPRDLLWLFVGVLAGTLTSTAVMATAAKAGKSSA